MPRISVRIPASWPREYVRAPQQQDGHPFRLLGTYGSNHYGLDLARDPVSFRQYPLTPPRKFAAQYEVSLNAGPRAAVQH